MRAGVLKALAIASPVSVFFFLTIGRPPRSPLFPYTTLFRSLPPVSKGRRAAARRSLLRGAHPQGVRDRKSTRLNSSHGYISYAAFCFKQNPNGRWQRHCSCQRHNVVRLRLYIGGG